MHRRLRSACDSCKYVPPVTLAYCARRMAEVVGCKICWVLYLCPGNHCSSASGEMAAQVKAFLKLFAGFLLAQCMLFRSDICENCVEDDS